jgi:hypothetical protein
MAVLQARLHRLGPGAGARPVHQQAGVRRQLGQAGAAGDDDRRAAGHGLEHAQAEGFLVTGMHIGVAAGHHARQTPAVGLGRQQPDLLADRRCRAVAHGHQHMAAAEQVHRVGQQLQMLLRREAAGVDQQPSRRVQPLLAAELGAPVGVPGAGMEDRAVHPQRLQRHARHAPGLQALGHAAAGRHDEVEMAVELHQIAPCCALGHLAQA